MLGKVGAGVVSIFAVAGGAFLLGDKLYVQPQVEDAYDRGKVQGYHEGEQYIMKEEFKEF